MYHYNKSKNRSGFTSNIKENNVFGPQFSLQVSSSSVNERPLQTSGKGIAYASSTGSREGSATIRSNHDNFSNNSVKASSPAFSQDARHAAVEFFSSFPKIGRPEGGGVYQQNDQLPTGPLGIFPGKNKETPGLFFKPYPDKGNITSPPPYRSTATYKQRQILSPTTATAFACDNPSDPLSFEFDRHSLRSSTSNSQTSTSSKTQTKQPENVYLPGDRVVFTESPTNPGKTTVFRSPEEKSSNPDRLNLDRRKLSACPFLEGEEQLRLLNYQHNFITKIQHLSALKRLIFLDLYDNQIETISGLHALKSLRVLMLGKNRIGKIENLENLTKLDVLDLHGNQISRIENLQHLTELRVLNLAGNQIQHVDNLVGMDALTELNLRRNRITTVVDVDSLPSIQRLFLSFNEITCFEDIACLGDSSSLSEVSLDGNPFAQEANYKQTVLRYMQQLRQFDMKRISEDERRIATVMARKEEEKKRESNKIAMMKERRKLAINNARRQWEHMQSSSGQKPNRFTKPDLVANHVTTVPNNEIQEIIGPGFKEVVEELEHSSRSSGRGSRPTSAKSSTSQIDVRDWPHNSHDNRPKSSKSYIRGNTSTRGAGENMRQETQKIIFSTPPGSNDAGLNIDHLAELDNDTLQLFGQGSLDALDRNWGIQAAGQITTLSFNFVDFTLIVKHLHKIRARFPSVHTLSFSSTNIHSFHQMNGLSALRRLDNLTISPEGNPITNYSLWRTYTLFRLAHFCMKKINDTEISASDIVNAEKFFGSLSHITTSQLPQSRLLSLLGESKRKQILALKDDKSGKGDNRTQDRSTVETVGRAGLVYNPAESLANQKQEVQHRKDFAKSYVRDLTKEALHVDKKHAALQKQWPQIFREMIKTAVIEMYDTQGYMKKCMEELENGKS